MKNKHDVHGKHYDDVVVCEDLIVTTLFKVEVLRPNQFALLMDRLAGSGFDDDHIQLIRTFFTAIRSDD